MAIKLIKACKELNIGMATLTAWCEKNGYAVESDPNVRIDDDLYLLLAKEFNKDMVSISASFSGSLCFPSPSPLPWELAFSQIWN